MATVFPRKFATETYDGLKHFASTKESAKTPGELANAMKADPKDVSNALNWLFVTRKEPTVQRQLKDGCENKYEYWHESDVPRGN